MPPVRHQGKLGTCVGHAAWAIKEWQERQQGDNPESGLSPRFIYQMAKQLDGIPGTPGTYPRTALQVAQEYGDCPENVFPYSELPGDINLPTVPSGIIRAGEQYKIKVYSKLSSLDELKRAIVEQGPTMLCVTVAQNFVDAKNYVPAPAGTFLGGHAICACGYDDAIKLGPYTGGVLFMNSWGKSWGVDGFCWLPYAAWTEPWWIDQHIGWKFIAEMWACVDVPWTPKMAKWIVLKINNPTAFVDGEYIQLDVPPKLENGRTIIPIRFVAERMGYVVNWQEENSLVELKRPY